MEKDINRLPEGLPAPEDDGGAAHLPGLSLPDIALPSTAGGPVELAGLKGRTVLYVYPRTGVPGKPSLVDDWEAIPGARGCTPQSCAFRDHHAEIGRLGARVLGLSTQDTAFQREAVERLHLPFPLLSDQDLRLTRALDLPTMVVADTTLLKRLGLIVDSGVIRHVFYPVFPPDRHAELVLDWLSENMTDALGM